MPQARSADHDPPRPIQLYGFLVIDAAPFPTWHLKGSLTANPGSAVWRDEQVYEGEDVSRPLRRVNGSSNSGNRVERGPTTSDEALWSVAPLMTGRRLAGM
jgi:hypothetical protein